MPKSNPQTNQPEVSVQAIDALLPQTQCGECGYAGCLPYAEAMAHGAAPINRCPPGGLSTLRALANLLHLNAEPYVASVTRTVRDPSVVSIREAECIGCTKCIQACPVDAIIGAGKLMHSVLTHECTGCGLCIEPCPVDCIEQVTLPEATYSPQRARERYQAREVRLLREEHSKQQVYREKIHLTGTQQPDKKIKKDYILEAMARVKMKKSHE